MRIIKKAKKVILKISKADLKNIGKIAGWSSDGKPMQKSDKKNLSNLLGKYFDGNGRYTSVAQAENKMMELISKVFNGKYVVFQASGDLPASDNIRFNSDEEIAQGQGNYVGRATYDIFEVEGTNEIKIKEGIYLSWTELRRDKFEVIAYIT